MSSNCSGICEHQKPPLPTSHPAFDLIWTHSCPRLCFPFLRAAAPATYKQRRGEARASIVRCLISETRVLARSSSAAGGPVSPDYPNPGQVVLSILSHPSPWAYLQVIMEAEELWWPWPPSVHRISHVPCPAVPQRWLLSLVTKSS